MRRHVPTIFEKTAEIFAAVEFGFAKIAKITSKSFGGQFNTEHVTVGRFERKRITPPIEPTHLPAD
jgi:hypothetical protein